MGQSRGLCSGHPSSLTAREALGSLENWFMVGGKWQGWDLYPGLSYQSPDS